MKKIFLMALSAFVLQHSIAQVDRTKKPAAGPAPVVTFKDPVIYNLPNGMTVLVVENHKLPKVSASLIIDAGPIREGNKAGVTELMGNMLGEGTKTQTKGQFDEAVDIIGADVNLSAGGGSASSLTRYFDKAFALLADALRNPAFPQESLDKLKQQTITGLKSEEKNAKTIAARVSQALSYGKNTAMGEFETEATVKSITLADIQDAYKNYITPSRSYLTFVGDITPAAAKALAEKYFGSWTGKKLTLPSIPDVKNPDKTEIDFVDVPTAVQAEMAVGNLVTNPMNGSDYHALLLANHILGGGAEAKLFMNLREKHGFTYGSYSQLGSGRFQSLFKATAAVRTDKADSAVAEIIAEILNMRDGKITQDELDNAKAIYNGSFALGMEDPSRSARYASNILINNLPKDFYRTYLQKINALTIEDIKRVSKNYLNETNSRIVIVGNGSKILPTLLRLGYPIKKYDKWADPVIDSVKNVNVNESPKTTDKVSAYSIVEDYLKAIGGKEELKKITSINQALSLDMMGRSFEGTDKRQAPYKTAIEIRMGTMTVMRSVFNGTTGYQAQMGQKKDMTMDEIKEQNDEQSVIPQLAYASANYKMEYVGSGSLNGENTYRLKVTMPSGRVSVQQYSSKTGLLLQEETTTKDGDQDTPMTITYADYKKVGNYLFPFSVTRNTGEQEIAFKYTSIKVNEGVTEEDFK
ncbi:pitrilysin family protein [Ferruginibacter sp. HRS2-29]|uniref:M16 family metallopeptidase n=1 Tax=Ferruginibacter sp. HRS2-29 TaxID=2487334 RepID=UPI0020CEE397|nr:pitrilysin family protein [Ferruginibacter sp. HRS2-29]MCP9752704.1 insulinase family protein [Ferruginibacter sp. HRS2-29]